MNILVFLEDPLLNTSLSQYLRLNGIRSYIPENAFEALHKAFSEEFSIFLCGFHIPPFDGLTVCSMLRQHKCEIPLFLITAYDREIRDKISISGVNEIFGIPFSFDTLISRLSFFASPHRKDAHSFLKIHDLTIDCVSGTVFREKIVIPLKHREFQILTYLAFHPNKVFTRTNLLEHIWGSEKALNVHMKTIDVHIHNLRQKIDFKKPHLIETVHGFGYKISA